MLKIYLETFHWMSEYTVRNEADYIIPIYFFMPIITVIFIMIVYDSWRVLTIHKYIFFSCRKLDKDLFVLFWIENVQCACFRDSLGSLSHRMVMLLRYSRRWLNQLSFLFFGLLFQVRIHVGWYFWSRTVIAFSQHFTVHGKKKKKACRFSRVAYTVWSSMVRKKSFLKQIHFGYRI